MLKVNTQVGQQTPEQLRQEALNAAYPRTCERFLGLSFVKKRVRFP